MITEEIYLESLEKLREREKSKEDAKENGKKFVALYIDALNKSNAENKHIFLFFYVKGCDGCNVVRYMIQNNQEVKEALKNYIVLQCDVSQTITNLTNQYNLHSYPSYFIINSQEKILKQKVGITVKNGPHKDFLSWLE